MSDKKPPSATITVNTVTGDFFLQLPTGFDYDGPGMSAVDAILPTVPARRSSAA